VTSSFVVIDIGANLTSSKYARDLDSVIDRAKDAGMLRPFNSADSDFHLITLIHYRSA